MPGTVYVIFSTQMWPENQVSRVLGEVNCQETLFDMFFTKKSVLRCFKLVYSLILYVLFQ